MAGSDERIAALAKALDELSQAVNRYGPDSAGHNRVHGTNSHVPRQNFGATAAPTVNDDITQGYGPGSEWVNVTGSGYYICISNAAGAAVWVSAADVAASLTVAGHVELATTAEINTGTDTTRAMPIDQYVASNRNVRYVMVRCLEQTVQHTVSTNVCGDFEMPFTGTIVEIGAYVDTAGTTGVGTIDVNKNGTTVISTKITLDSTEKSSRTAATPPVISVTAIAAGDLITVDIDGIQSTAARGLSVRIGVRLT